MALAAPDRHVLVLDAIKYNPGQPNAAYLAVLSGKMSYTSMTHSLYSLEKAGDIYHRTQACTLSGKRQKYYFPVDVSDVVTDGPYRPWSDAWLLTKSWTNGSIIPND